MSVRSDLEDYSRNPKKAIKVLLVVHHSMKAIGEPLAFVLKDAKVQRQILDCGLSSDTKRNQEQFLYHYANYLV
jgi:hypothetical protein